MMLSYREEQEWAERMTRSEEHLSGDTKPLFDYSKGKWYTTLKGRLFIEDEDATRK
jgi:hypothetical protein